MLSSIINEKSNTISRLETVIADNQSYIILLRDTLSNERDTIKQRNIQIQELNSDIFSYRDSLEAAELQLLSLKAVFPINIINIQINDGNTIYSAHTTFLTPEITYIGINTECHINLKIRWYAPDGSLIIGASSPSGYSQQESLYVYSGLNTQSLNDWGYETKGHWGKGEHRIEIWYENVCLKSETFIIY